MNQQEVEIRLSDLFAALLKALRPILCFSLILALLGCGLGLFRARRPQAVDGEAVVEAEEAVELAAKQLDLAESALTRYRDVDVPAAEKKISQAQLAVDQRREYLGSSLYQALDPFNCGVSSLTFYVRADQVIDASSSWVVSDQRASIVRACEQLFSLDDELLAGVREIMGSEADLRYIKEMVSVTGVSDQFVQIRAYNADAQTAEKVVDYLFEAIPARLSDSMGEFSLVVISRFTGYDLEWSVKERQAENEEMLLSAEGALSTAQEDLKTLLDEAGEKDKAVVDAQNALNAANDTLTKLRAQLDPAPSRGKVLRSAAIGLLAGLVLGCGAALFRFLASGRLQNQSAALSRWPFPILGVLPNGKKRLFAGTIRRLEGDPDTDFETAARVAAQRVCDLAEGKKPCLISSLGEAATGIVAPYLGEKTPVCGDILRDPAAAKALAGFDSTVLVETRGVSRVDQIDGEVQQLRALGKEILGVVLL